MAIFKCKMCGGTLNFTEGSTVAECECCGMKQTLPKLSDEKRTNLYDRANHFRRNNDYDKALLIYEQILNEDKTDAEAYWSIVLCKYGIEYVEDPSTHKRIPTVNRTQFTSIFADEDYKSAIANADGYQRDLYEAEAKEIDKIQKGILAISGKESPYDVFICYKETDNGGRRTQDSVLAHDLYFGLKNEGFNVFFSRITLEDKLGSAYEPHIFAAIHSAKVMVVLGTKAEHFNAVWVKNEWSRYLALIKRGENKTLIPAYKDMDPYDLPDEFSHLQAQDMSKLGFMQDLLRGIKKIVEADREKSGPVKETVVVSGKQDITPLLKRAFLFLEDGDFTNADEYVEKVLDINPECAEAYIVKLLSDLRLRKPEQLTTCPSPIASNSNFSKAIRFASLEYRNVLQEYKNANIEHIAKAKEQARKEAIYEQALDRLSVAPDDIAYKKSIAELESIIDYKDAKEQIERIKTLLDAWYVTQEKERIYREEQAEKAKIYAEEQRLEKQRKLEQQKIVEQRAKAKKKKGKKSPCLSQKRPSSWMGIRVPQTLEAWVETRRRVSGRRRPSASSRQRVPSRRAGILSKEMPMLFFSCCRGRITALCSMELVRTWSPGRRKPLSIMFRELVMFGVNTVFLGSPPEKSSVSICRVSNRHSSASEADS